MSAEIIPLRGAQAHCLRCHVPLVVAESRNADVHPVGIRYAATPVGFCRPCVVTQWAREVWPKVGIGELTLDAIRLPHVQAQLERLFAAARSDPDTVSWERVIQLWDLPFPVTPRKRTRNAR